MSQPKFDGLRARRKIELIRQLAQHHGHISTAMVCEQLHLCETTAHCYIKRFMAEDGLPPAPATRSEACRDPMVAALFGKAGGQCGEACGDGPRAA